jgi:hypothetical protein
MAFITLGSAQQLVIKVPTLGSTDWGDVMRTDTFLKIAEHNHTGSGSGEPLSAGSFAADSITGASIRLDNNEYIRARNVANSGDINTIKVDTNDNLTIGADFAAMAMINDTYYTGRNNADSAYINLFKIGTDDKIAVGATILAASIETTSTSLIDTLSSAVTLADNQSAITAGIVTLSTDESCAVHYRIVRNGVTQSGVVRFNDADTVPSESFHGTNIGVTFTVSSGALFYATTSTGNTGSMTYVVIKE